MPFLPPYVQIITWNIQLLRKSKEDVQVDVVSQNEAWCFALSESMLNNEDNSDNDAANNNDIIRSLETMNDSISLETLHLAFSVIKNK